MGLRIASLRGRPEGGQKCAEARVIVDGSFGLGGFSRAAFRLSFLGRGLPLLALALSFRGLDLHRLGSIRLLLGTARLSLTRRLLLTLPLPLLSLAGGRAFLPLRGESGRVLFRLTCLTFLAFLALPLLRRRRRCRSLLSFLLLAFLVGGSPGVGLAPYGTFVLRGSLSTNMSD